MKRLKIVLILISFGVCCNDVKCMAQSHFVFSAGYGYYELLNAGVAWKYSEKSSIGASYGTNLNHNDNQQRSVGLFYDHLYIKPLFSKIRPGFSLKTVYWTQNDLNYYFSNMAFAANLAFTYDLSSRLSLLAEGGGVLNYVIKTERKQNTEAGSPVRANGNCCISLRYNLYK